MRAVIVVHAAVTVVVRLGTEAGSTGNVASLGIILMLAFQIIVHERLFLRDLRLRRCRAPRKWSGNFLDNLCLSAGMPAGGRDA